MELSLQINPIIFSFSYLFFWRNELLIKGARPFLLEKDKDNASIAKVDNLMRFLSRIYFSAGFLFLGC